jgi:thioredoxin reductase (NADPH)
MNATPFPDRSTRTTAYPTRLIANPRHDKTGAVAKIPGKGFFVAIGHAPASDPADPVYRQAVPSAGKGCMVALHAETWMAESAGATEAAE